MKTESKMAQSKVIFDDVYAKDANLDGKSPRSVFIERVIAELGMTKHGASNYHQNLRNHVIHGKGLYEYNKRKTPSDKVEDKDVGEALKASITSESPRWMVVLDNQEVAAFKSKVKAAQYARDMEANVMDRRSL